MIVFSNLAIRRGRNVLFEQASTAIHAGWKVGLTGRNGSGKSSLLALLMGQLHADAGDCQLPSDWVIAHVAQETPALPQPILEFVLDGDQELRNVQARISRAEAENNGNDLARLHLDLEHIGGYTAEARAARLLNGLGFASTDLQRPVAEFSGGFRMRLNLARALMCRSDLLLLDEPTNHLDLDAVIWLEQWLQSYPGTLVLISHDRDFLDNTINHILHLEQGRLHTYSGNYSEYERQHAAELARQSAMQARQQQQVRHLQSYIDRFRAKATKARQAQSRLKALERMETIAVAHVDAPFSFAFSDCGIVPNPLLQLEQVGAGYADRTILSRVNLHIEPGTRIGLIGPNGAGKSTLMRILAGTQEALDGKRRGAKNLKVGYFAQHTLESIDSDATPVQHVLRLSPLAVEQQVRDFLGGFGFQGEQALSNCAGFSGGEKARLVLALLVWQQPNLLLLDEPTNHLDLEMRHALTLALQEFGGAMVVVSHDRYLLRAVTDELWLVAEGRAAAYDGDLDDYRQWLQQHRQQQANTAQSDTLLPVRDRKAERREAAEVRRQRQPLVNRVRKLEQVLDELRHKRSELEQALADPDLYEPERLQDMTRLQKQLGDLGREQEETEMDWLEASEALEQFSADD